MGLAEWSLPRGAKQTLVTGRATCDLYTGPKYSHRYYLGDLMATAMDKRGSGARERHGKRAKGVAHHLLAAHENHRLSPSESNLWARLSYSW